MEDCHRRAPKRSELSENQLHLIAKALADPRRHEILQQIAADRAGVACSDVRECQSVTAATLSLHLKEMEAAGSIEIVRSGKFANLILRREALEAYRRHPGALLRPKKLKRPA